MDLLTSFYSKSRLYSPSPANISQHTRPSLESHTRVSMGGVEARYGTGLPAVAEARYGTGLPAVASSASFICKRPQTSGSAGCTDNHNAADNRCVRGCTV